LFSFVIGNCEARPVSNQHSDLNIIIIATSPAHDAWPER
jgi:hypothetical protein